MTVYDSIMQSLEEAVAYVQGHCDDAKVHVISSEGPGIS